MNAYLLSTDLDLFESVDLETLDALSGISVPEGWTYESYVAEANIIADSGGATRILVLELGRTKWELHAASTPVPMLPGPAAALLASILATFGALYIVRRRPRSQSHRM